MRVRPRGPKIWLTIWGAVEHRRLGGEAWRAAHRALEPHHLLDPIETAKGRFQLRDRVESAEPEGLISLLGTLRRRSCL